MTQRTDRVDELLRQEIGAILTREVKDPRIGFATVTRVETAPDLAPRPGLGQRHRPARRADRDDRRRSSARCRSSGTSWAAGSGCAGSRTSTSGSTRRPSGAPASSTCSRSSRPAALPDGDGPPDDETLPTPVDPAAATKAIWPTSHRRPPSRRPDPATAAPVRSARRRSRRRAPVTRGKSGSGGTRWAADRGQGRPAGGTARRSRSDDRRRSRSVGGGRAGRGRARPSSAPDRVLIVSHENPDADTLGAALGVATLVEAHGGRATTVCTDPVPPSTTSCPASSGSGPIPSRRVELRPAGGRRLRLARSGRRDPPPPRGAVRPRCPGSSSTTTSRTRPRRRPTGSIRTRPRPARWSPSWPAVSACP